MDTEVQCNQAFLDLLPELAEPVSALVLRYRGMKLAPVLRDLEKRLDRALPPSFETAYRARVAELFELGVAVMPGAREMLERLSCTSCIASSGPPEKIRHSLRLSDLAGYFGDRVFSSYEVGSWKPEPGLFLHAARALGFRPQNCIVVEDSAPGLLAAKAAGMRAIHFSPDGIESAMPSDDRISGLSELPALVKRTADHD